MIGIQACDRSAPGETPAACEVSSSMSDIYVDPQLARWLGSMEGVPEWPEPSEESVERTSRTTLQNQLHQIFGWLGSLCPGVVLALGLAFVGLRGRTGWGRR